ncbi:hypothetical protein HPP92_003104 [Vanilla planifolia]|uniref:Uncharacterized protein n=1 Tax=Vanilla planifolia TaxID=51239 RepID=A0A835VIK6_VANPL|nr:hypothetical protein HPP92_003104 [Vanilla planifolia]
MAKMAEKEEGRFGIRKAEAGSMQQKSGFGFLSTALPNAGRGVGEWAACTWRRVETNFASYVLRLPRGVQN